MPYRLSRRSFGKLVSAVAGAAALPGRMFAATEEQRALATSSSSSLSFPQGFLWGSATASYQVEGAV
ncbi:MAG TPA: family 1 glycosylhydrolase, partial [Terriglobus sp.]